MDHRAIMLLGLLPLAAGANEVRPGDVRLEAEVREPDIGVSLQHSDHDARRSQMEIHWGGRLESRWTVHTDLRIERRTGLQTVGATIGSNGGNARAALLQAPVDHTTREWSLAVTYSGTRAHATAELILANFSNGEDGFRWQNPFPAVGGWAPGVGAPDGVGQLAREPDNSASQLAVGWAWRNPGGLHVNIDAAIGRHRQNESFLPYTVNPALVVTQPLPRPSLDGRVSRERFGVHARWPLSPQLDLDMRWLETRSRDRTPPALFVMVAGDAVNQPATIDSGAARWRLPREHERARLEARLDWRPGRRDRLRLTWAEERVARSHAEVSETVEAAHTLEWRRGGARYGHLRFQRADRDASAYRDNVPFLLSRTDEYLATVSPELQFENHPLLRRFNMADRRRDTWQGGFGWSGETAHLGLAFNHRSDRYRDSVFGLTSSTQRGWQADFGVATGSDTHVTVWLAHERWRSTQEGRQFRGGGFLASDLGNPDRNWTAQTEDRARMAGVSWRHRAPWTGGEISIDLSESRNTTQVTVTAGPAIASAPLPRVSTRIRRVSASASHRFSESWQARLAVEHQRWRSLDWAYDGVTASTVSSILGLGDGLPQGGYSWVSAQFQWRF